MHFNAALTALVGLSALAAAAPAPVVERDVTPAEKGLRHKTRHQKRAPLVIQQTVVESSITVVEENLDLVNSLAITAEQELAALLQSQLALIQQVQIIQDNIRVNHFRSRFSQVNTVIVTVTQVVDLRNSAAQNNRYLVNQLLADNGKPESEVVVMVTAAVPMTINLASPSLALSGLLSSVTAISAPTGTPSIGAYDPNAPFGQFNQSVLLPYGSQPPSLSNSAQIFADPAAIILPGQSGLFVENIAEFSQDCAFWSANDLTLFNLATEIITVEQVSVVEASGLSLGSNINDVAAELLSGGVGSSESESESASTSTVFFASSSTTTAASYSSTAASAVAAGSGAGIKVVPVPQ